MLSVFLTLAVMEAYFFWQNKQAANSNIYQKKTVRNTMVHEKLGMIFHPNMNTIHSNGSDYYVEEKTNRYGFLDRDYSPEKPADTYRILFIGDSFVESVQVPIKDKFHVQLEAKLNNTPHKKKVQTMALGFSGMGSVNELVFYEHLGRALKPDLVFLVFIANDFHNNSPCLHAINEGWHPYKGPRFFYELDHTNGKLFPVNINQEFEKFYLVVQKPVPVDTSFFMDSWFTWSSFYPYMKDVVRKVAGKNDEELFAENDLYNQRIKQLRKAPFFEQKLKGWNYPKDLGLVSMYLSDEMPQVFEESMRFTEISLELIKKMVESDDGKFAIVGDHFLTTETTKKTYGRNVVKGNLLKRLKKITNTLDIDVIDLYQEFSKRGSISEASWRNDSHWSLKAHGWVADAVYEHILRNKYLE